MQTEGESNMDKTGFVSFVGAGPGDAGLITSKALERLKLADVILYDRLVNPLLLEECGPHTLLVYCGKLPDRHLLRQESINDLLIQYALEGKNVVRLKGGDPGVFGRVGEEALALEPYNIAYEIIPGITSGIAAPLYAGVPVTHRNLSTSFAIVTAHNQKGSSTVDWQSLAKGIDTIAFYMGVKSLDEITENLMKYGRNPDEPVKVIQWGTLGKQRTITATLATIAEKSRADHLSNPAITLVGKVAGLGQGQTNWFERQPLFNTHILLARSSAQIGKGAKQLQDLGAEVFEYPRFQVQANEYPDGVNLFEYDQIHFKSEEAVTWFFNWLSEKKIDIRQIKADIYSDSGAAQHALKRVGIQIGHKSLQTKAKSLILGATKPSECKETDTYVETHQQIPFTQSNHTLKRLYDEQRFEIVVFPNAKSIAGVVNGIKELALTPAELSTKVQIICFGQASEKAAIEAGFTVTYTLSKPSWHTLTDWLLDLKKEVNA